MGNRVGRPAVTRPQPTRGIVSSAIPSFALFFLTVVLRRQREYLEEIEDLFR